MIDVIWSHTAGLPGFLALPGISLLPRCHCWVELAHEPPLSTHQLVIQCIKVGEHCEFGSADRLVHWRSKTPAAPPCTWQVYLAYVGQQCFVVGSQRLKPPLSVNEKK
jgi:hypothetical protein